MKGKITNKKDLESVESPLLTDEMMSGIKLVSVIHPNIPSRVKKEEK